MFLCTSNYFFENRVSNLVTFLNKVLFWIKKCINCTHFGTTSKKRRRSSDDLEYMQDQKEWSHGNSRKNNSFLSYIYFNIMNFFFFDKTKQNGLMWSSLWSYFLLFNLRDVTVGEWENCALRQNDFLLL